jgi:hypothetical protein
MHNGHGYGCTIYMNIDMQHGHGHTKWTRTWNIDMVINHRPGHAAWTCHEALTWTCSMDMDIDIHHGLAVWTWTYTMDMHLGNRMHLGHRHVPGTETCNGDRGYGSTYLRLDTSTKPKMVNYWWCWPHHKKQKLYLKKIYKLYLTKICFKPSYTDILKISEK